MRMPTMEEEPMVYEFGGPQKCDTLILRLYTVPLNMNCNWNYGHIIWSWVAITHLL